MICDACELKPLLLSEDARSQGFRVQSMKTPEIAGARDIAKTEAYVTSRRERKKIEMQLFAHLKRHLCASTDLRLEEVRLVLKTSSSSLLPPAKPPKAWQS